MSGERYLDREKLKRKTEGKERGGGKRTHLKNHISEQRGVKLYNEKKEQI